MKWFRFYPDVVLENGVVRSTLYFLGEKKTIHLNKHESEIIRAFENNPIEKVEEIFGKEIVNRALDTMLENGMGNVYNWKAYAEPYKPHVEYDLDLFFQNELKINDFYIQTGTDSKYNADDMEFITAYEGCCSFIAPCKETPDYQGDFKIIKDSIAQLSENAVKNFTIGGGNPFSEWKSVKSLIDFILEKFNTNVTIVCPNTQVSEECLKYIYEKDIILKISVFINELNDATKLQKFRECIENYIEKDIYVKLNLIYDARYDCDTNIENQIRSWNMCSVDLTHLLYKTSDRLIGLDTNKKRVENIDMNQYYERINCRTGKVAILSNGEIRPCAFSKIIWDKNPNNLFSVFEKNLQKDVWFRKKKDVKVCSKCENKFACYDCSIVHEMMENNVDSLRMMCSYDPNIGIWTDGEETRGDFEWQ
ncbi:MAG: hypothetical protein E7510_01875 [Ruminococcus sp.]|nr:hypothetical protein [Ruminococcus sp.]